MSEADAAAEPEVVIVGAGPSGLALAIELGRASIPCLVVERNPREGYAPRAKTTHTRTREHLRRWGIAGKLAAASPFGVDYPSDVLFVTRLSGPLIARFPNAFNCAPARDDRYAEHSQWIPQYKLERVLREHAQTLPSVKITFGQEFVSFSQDREGVCVCLKDVPKEKSYDLKCHYIVGADGARSSVRESIGAKMVGRYGISRHYNTIFRAPGLGRKHAHGDTIMIWQINADVPSILGPMDVDDLWYFTPLIPIDGAISNEEMRKLICTSMGIDTPIEILSSDEWMASTLIADKYAEGRAFLIGDACHLHPPFGGYGMNMGVADAVDLGWKLAATLRGWGGPSLLDSYEAERRPNHQFVIDEAAANHALLPHKLIRTALEEATPEGEKMRREIGEAIERNKRNEFYSLGVPLGYRYEDSPVIAYQGDDSWQWSREYTPTAAPGCRAPHAWLDDGRSLYDTFGAGLTLLWFDREGADDVRAATEEAELLGAPLDIAQFDAPALQAIYKSRFALVRPDQHIAWCGDRWAPGAIRIATGNARPRGAEVRRTG